MSATEERDKSADDKIDELVARYPEFWKTKSAYMSFIRSGIRGSLWNKNKVKLLKIKQNRVQIKNTNPRGKKPTVWGGSCEICNNLFTEKELQVDHIRDSGSSLKCFDDLPKFIEDMILVTEDDLRILCINCHSIVSHSQKRGITFEQAKIEKYVISLDKNNKVLDVLTSLNINCIPSTKAKRKALLLEILLKDLENKDV